ncbi:hypothetical protein [Labilibacter marinus]|uniref:hypothetical protein n=1 Tax=Labilibacter marinus TaxID=1477105 RepID=UPI0009F896A7|nr:hypothetical protein [Labilibacter marinus]
MYYNLNKRQEKGKRIDGNSGNYVSIRVGYQPGLAVSSDNSEFYPSVSILPMWGIKRNIGKSFNYEVGMGIGYYWAFKEYTPFYSNEMTNYTERGLALGLRLGIGYKF